VLSLKAGREGTGQSTWEARRTGGKRPGAADKWIQIKKGFSKFPESSLNKGVDCGPGRGVKEVRGTWLVFPLPTTAALQQPAGPWEIPRLEPSTELSPTSQSPICE
jgi:hypothetical protein